MHSEKIYLHRTDGQNLGIMLDKIATLPLVTLLKSAVTVVTRLAAFAVSEACVFNSRIYLPCVLHFQLVQAAIWGCLKHTIINYLLAIAYKGAPSPATIAETPNRRVRLPFRTFANNILKFRPFSS